MRAALLALTLVLPALSVAGAAHAQFCDVPLAAFGAEGCVGDFGDGDATCESTPIGQRATGVFLNAGVANAFAGGKSECFPPFEPWSGVQVTVFAGGVLVIAQWGTFGETCVIQSTLASHGCPLGLAPPDPGWGHLLP